MIRPARLFVTTYIPAVIVSQWHSEIADWKIKMAAKEKAFNHRQ